MDLQLNAEVGVGEEFVYRKTISYTFGTAQGVKRKPSESENWAPLLTLWPVPTLLNPRSSVSTYLKQDGKCLLRVLTARRWAHGT